MLKPIVILSILMTFSLYPAPRFGAVLANPYETAKSEKSHISSASRARIGRTLLLRAPCRFLQSRVSSPVLFLARESEQCKRAMAEILKRNHMCNEDLRHKKN